MSAPQADVLLAVSGADEDRLVEVFGSQRGAVRIVRRCADGSELLAVATSGVGTVALVCDQQPDVDRVFIGELHAIGIGVVVLVEDLTGPTADAFRAMGADAVCPYGIDPAALAELLVLPISVPVGAVGAAVPAFPEAPQQPVWVQEPAPTDGAHLAAPGPIVDSGRVVAVWGASGSPGRSTFAINLATELAALPAPEDPRFGAQGREVLLIDADTHDPSLAQHLGLLDESAGLALACRSAMQGRLTLERLAELSPRLDRRLRVLSGIGRPARWPEVPAPALETVWEVSRSLADVTVVDCAADIEADEALSYDTRAPQRNAATRSLLAAADVVILVGQADPVGVHRLLRALTDLDEAGLALHARRHVVLNRVRTAVVGANPEAILTDALARFAGVEVSAFVPDDTPAFDEAVFTGRTLAEIAPHSPARRTIADFAEDIAPAFVSTDG